MGLGFVPRSLLSDIMHSNFTHRRQRRYSPAYLKRRMNPTRAIQTNKQHMQKRTMRHCKVYRSKNDEFFFIYEQGEPSIQHGANQEGTTMKLACFDRLDILAKALMATVGAIAVAAFAGYKDIKQPFDSLTLATGLFLILTLVFGFVSWLYVNYMSNHNHLTNWQYMLHVMLVSLDGVCLMCTNVFLLALVNRVNALLACFLVVVPFIISILAYARSQTNGTDQNLTRDQAFEAAMKSCCDVAYLTVTGAFSMHVAVLFEYYKNPSLVVNRLPSVDLSVTFLASVLGVFLMMVTAMPLELLPLTVRSNLLLLVKFLKNSMLFLTAVAAMTLGGKFLDGLVLLVLIPIMAIMVAYQAVLLFTGGERVGPETKNFTGVRVDPEPNNFTGERVGPNLNGFTGERVGPETKNFTGVQVDPEPNNFTGERGCPNPNGFTGERVGPPLNGFTGARVGPEPNVFTGQQVDPNPNWFTGERVGPNPNDFTGERVGPDPNGFTGEPEIPNMLNGVATTCIVLLSSVYALYTVGENGDVYLRVGIFVLVGIIVSCLSWIAFLLNPSMNAQHANVTKLVIGILLGLMIIIVVAFLLKICVDLYGLH